MGRYGFKVIEDIILKGHYKLDWKEEQTSQMPEHDNIRGRDYYEQTIN
jgi:hypothetical protein